MKRLAGSEAEAGNILFGFLEQREGAPHAQLLATDYLELAATKIAGIARNDHDLGARVRRLVNEPDTPERDFVFLKTIPRARFC
jgi:hypothetical protein